MTVPNTFLLLMTIRGFDENVGEWIKHEKALSCSGLSPEIFNKTIDTLLSTGSIDRKTDSNNNIFYKTS